MRRVPKLGSHEHQYTKPKETSKENIIGLTGYKESFSMLCVCVCVCVWLENKTRKRREKCLLSKSFGPSEGNTSEVKDEKSETDARGE